MLNINWIRVVSLSRPFLNGLLFSFGLLCGTILYAVTVDLLTFKKGDLIKADDFNNNFTNLKTGITELDTRISTLETRIIKNEMPAGTILGWDRDFAYPARLVLPTLTNYVPCDGRTISDSESVYNGRSVPLLNDAVNGYMLIGGSESSLLNNYSLGSGLSTINTFSVVWLCKIK